MGSTRLSGNAVESAWGSFSGASVTPVVVEPGRSDFFGMFKGSSPAKAGKLSMSGNSLEMG